MDDRDLDDAELWAVIDSAAAAAVSSRSRKPLISPIPAPFFSPVPPKPFRNPRQQQQQQQEIRVTAIGEVVQEDHRWGHYHRPQKAARVADSHGGNQMVVRQSPQTPSATSISYSSPPDFSRGFSVKNVSPVVESPPPDHWKAEEENLRHSLSGQFPSVSLFKQYQNAAMAILEKTDYTMISGTPFIKKSGWRKISFFFNISFEIKDKSIEFDESRNVQRAEFLVRAYMQGGRFSDGWGSCERREKRFQKPNHDIPSTAETRAKNKACQDLLGIGEYRPGANNVPS